jgi:hypothetical protein
VDGSNGRMTQRSESRQVAGSGSQRTGDADVVDMRDRRHVRPIAYLVLPNAEAPFLLARVRWPDVYQAISAVRTDWQDDPGLFDLPYSPASAHISYEEAAEIAEEWGAELPSEDAEQEFGPSLIRRMPSDWSSLSTAERRAWSIEIEKPARRARASAAAASIELPEATEASSSAVPPVPARRRFWSRRRTETVVVPQQPETPLYHFACELDETLLIDLTDEDQTESARATADFA